MIKPTTFFLGLLLIFCHFSITAQTSPDHPNILLIIADDLGVDASNGFQDNTLMPSTPTLDSLRNSGLTFSNAWAYPACTPTRATIMSGKYGVNTGVKRAPGNLDLIHTSIFTAIANQTNDLYADAVIGKWHISQPVDLDHPKDHGVDHFDGVFRSGVDNYYNWEKVSNGVESIETTYATSYFTDAAIEWINEQDQPWFLWLAEVAPHAPFHEPPNGLYSLNSVGTNRRKYMAAIEAMDTEIGRLLRNIPSDELENTFIIYIGDNGTPGNVIQNFSSDRAKGTVYEGGIHVPLIVSGPAVSRMNEIEESIVSATDIYATILEITGADLQGGIHNSFSFYPLLSNRDATTKPFNYAEIESNDVNAWAIRGQRYKLIEFMDGNQEFYDLLIDPLEETNLIEGLTTNQAAIKQQLEQEASDIRTNWSCQDLIQNGEEAGVDCGGIRCGSCVVTSTHNPLLQKALTIFPNPTNGHLNIQSELGVIEALSIYSLQGQLLYNYQGLKEHYLDIDLSAFDSQIFMLQFQIDGKKRHKLIYKN